MRTFVLSIVALAALAGAVMDGAAGPTTFAVLRRDGVIVPFASHDGRGWVNRWPEPGKRIDIPISVDATPKSWWLGERPVATWNAWPIQGESRAIHVRNPVNLIVQCERHIGLQTDYSSTAPPVPRDMQPHPKDGLATSGDVLVEPIALLTSAAPEWVRVLEVIREPFTAEEDKAAARTERSNLALPDPPRRAQFPIEIEVLFRSPGSKPGSSVLYFEAVRRYGRKPAAGSIQSFMPDRRPLAYGAGWLTVNAAGEISRRGEITLTIADNQREGLLYVLPLGTFRIDDRRYWAVQRAGWGFERFEILEIADMETELTFKTAGGSCR